MTKFSDNVINFFKKHNLEPSDVVDLNDVNVMGLYSVYDKVANSYDVPFAAKTDGLAQRMFEQYFERSDMFKRHPEDYNLVRVGYFSQFSGVLIDDDNKHLCFATDFVKIPTTNTVLSQSPHN